MKKDGKKALIFLLVVFSLLFLSLAGLSIYEYVRIRPNNVHFSNITSSSVTVSWNTEEQVAGTVKVYEEDPMLPISVLGMDKRFFDTRDIKKAELLAVEKTSENIIANEELTLSVDNFDTEVVVDNMGEYYTHHVTVAGLDPEVEYSFMVGEEYLFRKVKDNNESVLVKTLPVAEEIRSPLPAYGLVKDAENQTELPIDELSVISDGVVYFNYYEETTGARSSVFSSTLSDSGAWYVDVATATDQSGEPFFETYNGVEHEFKIELTLDAGPLGVWVTKEINGSNSPTPPIIINYPSPIEEEDIEGSVIKISSVLDPFLQRVLAVDILLNPPANTAPNYNCDGAYIEFGGYCGPCYKKCSDGLYHGGFACPQNILCSRSCKDCNDSEITPSENPIKCGGHDLGTVSPYDGANCKVCSKSESNGYYIGAWETDNEHYDPKNNCKKREQCTQKTCAALSPGNYVFESCTATIEYTCSSETYNNENTCNQDVTCYKKVPKGSGDEDATCAKSCTELSEGLTTKYIFDECKKPDDSFICASHTFLDDGCGKQKTCFSIKNENIELKYTDSCSGKAAGDFCTRSDGLVALCDSNGNCRNSIAAPCQGLKNDMGRNCIVEGKEGQCNDSGVCVKKTNITEYCTENTTKLLYRGTGPTRERCNRGKWVSDPENKDNIHYNSECKLGNACMLYLFPRQRCVSSEGQVLVCKIRGWENDDNYEQAVIRTPISKGELCNNEDGCLCTSLVMSSTPVDKGSYCPNLNPNHCESLNNKADYSDTNGKVCSTDSKKYVCNKGECVLESDVKGVSDSLDENKKQTYIKGLIPKVNASSESYILDPQTGYIEGLDPGLYSFEYDNQIYTFTVEPWRENVFVYIDRDDNGEFDEGIDEKITELASIINLVTLQKNYSYTLSKGLNFISLPFLVSGAEYRTAAGLLQKLNDVYNNSFYSISKFDGSWKIVGQNVEVYDNNDFQLLPGEGYMIKSKRDINISIVGQPVKFESEGDKAPIYLTQGWNLIGFYGTRVKSYTAKTLIEEINVDNFTADNVTKWAKDKQMYEGFQLEGKEEYGFDYPLNKLESYFVRITQGKGNWQPSLSGNN